MTSSRPLQRSERGLKVSEVAAAVLTVAALFVLNASAEKPYAMCVHKAVFHPKLSVRK